MYERRDTDEGVSIEYALSSHAFQTTPALTWKYLLQIGRACCTACPNRAHEIIARIQSYKPHTWVLTQNINGLHRRAGTRNLIEIHGHAFDLFAQSAQPPY
ncbi:MAG: hypothetical protein JW795_00220, partial [Chitinivibrionales bacterium]|nr:hypothetical protein [Chitinivibrionales bacterium]